MTMALCSHMNQLTLAFVGATGGMAMRLISARELDDAPQGPGRLWVVHDWREGAVEIQALGDLARPLGQLRCVLGDRGVGGHGVRFSETTLSRSAARLRPGVPALRACAPATPPAPGRGRARSSGRGRGPGSAGPCRGVS